MTALRELALRVTATSVEEDLLEYMERRGIPGPWPATERLLVCVSPSPLSEKLVRSAKRLSQALDAEWYAVSVEPVGRPLSPENNERLQRNLRLAEALGAKLVHLRSSQVPESIISLARSHNVTKLIVGKPLRPVWQEWLRPSPVDQLIRLSGAIDVYVISSQMQVTASQLALQQLALGEKPWPRFTQALLCTILGTVVATPFSFWIPTGDLVMIYLMTVVAAAYYLGRGTAVLTSVLSVLAFDFCFVEPRWTFTVSDHGYILTFFGLLLTGLVVSSATASAREQAKAARERELDTAALFDISRKLATAPTESAIAELLHGAVANRLGACDLLLVGPSGLTRGDLEERELAVADWCYRNRSWAGAATETLTGSSRQWRPVQDTDGTVFAVLGFSQIPQTSSERSFVEALVSLISLNIQRLIRAAEAQKNQSLQAAEKLQRALLNSVSHDLRIPMVSINGALTTVRELGQKLEPQTLALVENALSQSERLNRLVENLLQISRIEAGALQLTLLPCDLQDLIGSTLDICQSWLSGVPLEVKLAENLPLVMLDFVLMQQVLINLLDNAAKFSPVGAAIEVGAACCEKVLSDPHGAEQVILWVSDRGPGVPPDRTKTIFERFFRANSTGIGLGLAICEGIVSAHGGCIQINTKHSPGTKVEVRLPIR